MCGVAKMRQTINHKIRGTVRVRETSKEIHQRRLYPREAENYLEGRVIGLVVDGTRNRERPRKSGYIRYEGT